MKKVSAIVSFPFTGFGSSERQEFSFPDNVGDHDISKFIYDLAVDSLEISWILENEEEIESEVE